MKTVRPFRLNWPKRIAQSGDMRRGAEKLLDGPGNSGPVALASFKQGEAFERSQVQRPDLDRHEHPAIPPAFPVGFAAFPSWGRAHDDVAEVPCSPRCSQATLSRDWRGEK
jgi:hypothetical protein